MTVNWSSPRIARIAEMLRERTGLVFRESRRTEVEATIGRFLGEHERRAGGWEAAVEREGDVLVAELTVGETYFERDPAQIEVLRSFVLPELLADGKGPPIWIWSAGCASGEEPYTLRILCEELGLGRQVHVVGTDIARPRLIAARRGIYTPWSLRASSAAMRARWFRARGNALELVPEIRDRVDFRYLNLAEDTFPSIATGIWGMDVVFCRNVLIYFDAATVERVADRLVRSLSERGWLFLGPSDPPLGGMVDCTVVPTQAGFLYRRPGRAQPPQSRPDEAIRVEPVGAAEEDPSEEAVPAASLAPIEAPPPQVPDDDPVAAAYDRRDFARVRGLASDAAARARLDERGWALWVRSLANEGCVEEAIQVTRRALAAHPTSAELHYLSAAALLERGLPHEAADAARRALYADRGMIVAHLALADAERRLRAPESAKRSLRNALRLLEQLPPDALVPASDGERAGRLAEFARASLRLVEVAA